MAEWKKIRNLPSKKCFGCGPANEVGLKLEFETNGEVVRTKTSVPERLAGWANLTHGGITATILDETMAWTSIFFSRLYILTKSMNVEFIKPVFVGDEVVCEGRILDRPDEREIRVLAELKNAKGELLARAEGSVALFTPRSIRKLGFLDEDFLREFEASVLNQEV